MEQIAAEFAAAQEEGTEGLKEVNDGIMDRLDQLFGSNPTPPPGTVWAKDMIGEDTTPAAQE